MSRTFRTKKDSSDKRPEKDSIYKCDCARCTKGKTRYQYVGKDLLSDGLKESSLTENSEV